MNDNVRLDMMYEYLVALCTCMELVTKELALATERCRQVSMPSPIGACALLETTIKGDALALTLDEE